MSVQDFVDIAIAIANGPLNGVEEDALRERAKQALENTSHSETRPDSLSSVKIGEDSKGTPHPEVKCYDGVSEDEMKRLGTLALDTFNSVVNRLGARANFS